MLIRNKLFPIASPALTSVYKSLKKELLFESRLKLFFPNLMDIRK